jgi:periplasmic protein TonB
MGYQALLFCPDEKTARVVTQVLSELEFEVDPCVETFAAVKKLMGAHFDAVVVDCENEQNATLLFKSARNSASNQTALAVAVVEGQTGVAKAFRIGANLVLTKPINIEQAKGTLRVARGLLRKGESAKAAPASTATQPAEPAPKPVMPTIPAKPAAGPARVLPPKPAPVVAPPIEKPAPKPAWPAPASAAAASAASQKSAPHDEEISEIILEEDTPEPPAKIASPIPATAATTAQGVASKLAPPIRPAATTASGAASAPARAPEVEIPKPTQTPAAKSVADLNGTTEGNQSAEKAEASAASYAPAPSFTFGGANVPESSGGNKKVLLAVAAVVIVVALGYFGWSSYQSSHISSPSVSAPKAAVTQPQPAQPAAPKTEVPVPSPAASQPAAAAPEATDDTEAAEAPAKPSASTKSSPSPKTTAKSAPSEPAPLVVKGGSVPSVKGKATVADVAAPSVIGVATGSSGELPPNLATNANAAKPVLQRLSISQGVSRGLLIKEVKPVYPQNALRLRRQGTVQLTATISKTGAVTSVKVLSGDEQFNKAATDAVKQWKYKPYLLNGEPIEVQTPITIDFRLPD